MKQDKDEVRLRHILDHAREALGLCKNRTQEDLERDRVLALALTRLLEIVGEAASKVSANARQSIPEIP